MKHVWIFGAGRSVGRAVLEHFLSRGCAVTAFSRTIPIQHKSLTVINVDFEDTEATRKAIVRGLRIAPPRVAIFCQRFRTSADTDDLSGLKRGIDVELAPVLTLAEERRVVGSRDRLSMVLLTSIAGLFSHRDLPFSYHMLKAGAVTLVRYLAARDGRENMNVNGVVLGEFLKHPIEFYTAREQSKFMEVAAAAPLGQVAELKDIVSIIDLLASDEASAITGQMLHADGGLSLLAQESVVREMLNRQSITQAST